MCISIHAPTRGATKTLLSQSCSRHSFQSTLPREERQAPKKVPQIIQAISIHAPTRGATDESEIESNTIQNFNPRSHERSDLSFIFKCFRLTYFNPRSHERSDISNSVRSLSGVLFQSTLPREERPSWH